MQAFLHNSEYMLHPCTNLCVLPVDGFLPFADLFAFDIPLDDSVLHAVPPQNTLHALAYICAVSVQLLPLVAIIRKCFRGLGIVHGYVRGHALLDELALGVHLRVALVAVVAVVALLRPAYVGVLVPFLVGLPLFIILCVTDFLIPQLAPSPSLISLFSLRLLCWRGTSTKLPSIITPSFRIR